jgi:iron complex outermembrane receptor protein
MKFFCTLLTLCCPAFLFAQQKDSTVSDSKDTVPAMKTQALKEIAITGKKKTFEVKGDKIIYNVASSVNAMGNSALELLRQSPGVTVDNNNNITLNGKGGVNIYIDGKPSYMQGDAIAAMLKSLQSANIASIELMPNPSAKYDAAGGGGIINIRLKKLTALGYNGDVSAGFHYGASPKTEAALAMNYRAGKYNLYANYNHYFGYNNMYYDYYRIQDQQIIDTRTADTDMRNPVNFKVGADMNLTRNSTIGAMVNGNLYFGPGLTNVTTFLKDATNQHLEKILVANNDYYSQRQNWMNYNVNYQFRDTAGRTFTTDLDYGKYRARIKNILDNAYLAPDGTTELSRNGLRTLNGSDIDIYGVKADYEQVIGRNKLQAGAKASFVKANNDVKAYDVAGKVKTLNHQRSNLFYYNENILAAYASYDLQLGQFKLQLGARVEQTDAKGTLHAKSKITQKDTLEYIHNNYLDLFPNANITYTPNDKHTFSLGYSKKIDRPGYASLNPFEYQLDELSYWKGNAFLRPQYVHNISFSYGLDGVLSSTLMYSRTNDFFSQITDTIDGNKIVMIPRNLGNQDLINLSINTTQNITRWWEASLNVNVFYKKNNISFDPARIMQLDVTGIHLNLQQVFSIGKKTQAELSAAYQSPTIGGGYERARYVWFANIGVQHKILKDKGTVKIALSDMFRTERWYTERDFDGIYFTNIGGRDSRQIKFNFSYRFGNAKLKSGSNRSSGLEDVSHRVK